MSVVIPLILEFVDVLPAGVTQEEGHRGFLHLPSAMLALIFLARRIQPFLSLVDREVEFCLYQRFNRSPLVGHYRFYFFIICIFVRKNPSSCGDTKIRTHVPTSEGFEVITGTTEIEEGT